MNVPFTEMLKSIPGAVGIRLEEELPFKVIRKIGELEVREYQPFTLAQVRYEGKYEDGSGEAFRKLAGFIFGNNDKNKKTPMTVPVFIDKDGSGWVMSFYLGEEAENLLPMDSSIAIQHMPQKTVAVMTYSGNFDQEMMEAASVELLTATRKAGLPPISDVWWAMFDQPASLPFTKRNEVLVKVRMENQ